MEDDVKVWHFCHVRKSAVLRTGVSLGRDVFIDEGVEVESGVRIQNGVSVYKGVKILKNCFVGPHVIFTNDLYPRVGTKKWNTIETLLMKSCSIGAGSIIRCGVKIGEFAMVGAGSIVTKDILPFHLSLGTPSKEVKKICACGQTIFPIDEAYENLISSCCKGNLRADILEYAAETLEGLKS